MDGGTLKVQSGASVNCYGYITGKKDADGALTATFTDEKTVDVVFESGSTMIMPFVMYEWLGGNVANAMRNPNNEEELVASPFTRYVFPNIDGTFRVKSGDNNVNMKANASIRIPSLEKINVGSIKPPQTMEISIISNVSSNNPLIYMPKGDGYYIDVKHDASERVTLPNTLMGETLDPFGRMYLEFHGTNDSAIKLNPLNLTKTINLIVANYTVTISSNGAFLPVTYLYDIHLVTGKYDISNQYIKIMPGGRFKVGKDASLTASKIIVYEELSKRVRESYKVIHYPVLEAAKFTLNGSMNITGAFGGYITCDKGYSGRLTFASGAAAIAVSHDYNGNFKTGTDAPPAADNNLGDYSTTGVPVNVIITSIGDYARAYYDTTTLSLKLDAIDGGSPYDKPNGYLASEQKWAPDTVTVTYDLMGGNASYTSHTGTCGLAGHVLNLPTENPTKIYYTFSHWCTNKNCTSDDCTDKFSTGNVLFRDTTAFACWTPNTYTVTFDSGWDDIPDTTREVVFGTAIGTLPSLTKTGYTFVGWFTEPGGAGAQISSATKLQGAGATYYAKWTANVYNLTFYSDGAELTDERMTVTYGDKYGTLPNLKKDGFIFEGWRLGSVDGIAVDANTEVTTAADHALYAKWKEATHTVTVTFTEGDTVKTTKTYEIGAPYSEGGNLYTYSKTGYTLSWFTTSDFQDGTEITNATVASEDVTVLYAKWTANTYTVTLNIDGTTTEFGTVTYGQPYGDAGTLPTPTKFGYSFVGWYNGDTAVTDESTVDTASNHTLVARFTKGSYTVTFDYGYDSITETKDVIFEAAIGELPTPTREGYTFNGWFTASSGGTQISADTVLNTEGVTYYAQWTVIEYTIKLGTLSNASVSGVKDGDKRAYGTTVTVTVSFTKSNNKTFTVTDGNGNIISSGSTAGEYTFTMPASDVTISASSEDSCLVEGTLITMADGTQKPVEELKVGDMVLVFNHVTGKMEAMPIIFNNHQDQAAAEYDVLNLQFSSGKEVKIVASHGFFDMTLMQYVYITTENYHNFIGHEFYYMNEDGSTDSVTLSHAFIQSETVRIFCPVTYFHMNSFANGFLNTPNIPGDITGLVNYFEYDSDLKYNEEKMQADIEKYGLYTYEDFSEYISEAAFNSSPSVYLKVAVGKGMITFEEIVAVIEYLLSGSLIE